MNKWMEWFTSAAPGWAANLVAALLIVLAGSLLARLAVRAVKRVFARSKLKDEQLLIRLTLRAVRASIMILAGIVALDRIGISIAPFIAGLGVGGLVLGFAFRDSLSNFAAGLLILIYRPFRLDDVVDIGGNFGKVIDLSIVNTTIKDFAGPLIFLPNSMVWGSKITNISRADFRRQIFTVSISYGDDQQRARELLAELVAGDERIVKEPAPFIRLGELADSGVNFQIFVYCKPSDFGSLLNDFYVRAKTVLEEAGFTIPFPQRDVHIYRELEGGAS